MVCSWPQAITLHLLWRSKHYPGYNSDDLQDYVFIPFPSLKLRYIFWQTREFDEDEDNEDDDDEEEDSGQDDDKVQEEDVNEGEGEEACWSKGEGESEKEQSPEGEEIGAG